MEAKEKFNLVKYVYGRLYAETFAKSEIVEETWKVNSWIGILKWMKKESYLISYKVHPQIDGKKKIEFKFNYSKLMYQYYLDAIKKKLQAGFVPYGEMITHQEEPSQLEKERLAQIKKPVVIAGLE